MFTLKTFKGLFLKRTGLESQEMKKDVVAGNEEGLKFGFGTHELIYEFFLVLLLSIFTFSLIIIYGNNLE